MHGKSGFRMKQVYIVDDDESVRSSLAFFLSAAGFEVRAYASGRELVAEAAYLAGCVLLDVRMPGMDGFAVIAALSAHRARLPVVIMSGHGDIASAVRAMQAGALDFLEKPFDEKMLLDILARVFAFHGHRVRDHDRRTEALTRMTSLSERELEVLQGLIAGHSNKVLAYDLGISVRTVEMHRASMMDRLGVRSLAEALRIAFDCGAETVTADTASNYAA